MKLVVGLGNPDAKYKETRHNAGFLALDFYLQGKDVIDCASKFEAKICEMHEGSDKIFFVKPTTYMNESGRAVKAIADFYKVDIYKDLLVIHDDKDLPLGAVREAYDSSSAGHNGVESIIDYVGTQSFHRVRIGVESRTPDDQIPTDAFVLQNFSDEELQKLRGEVFPVVDEQINHFLAH